MSIPAEIPLQIVPIDLRFEIIFAGNELVEPYLSIVKIIVHYCVVEFCYFVFFPLLTFLLYFSFAHTFRIKTHMKKQLVLLHFAKTAKGINIKVLIQQ